MTVSDVTARDGDVAAGVVASLSELVALRSQTQFSGQSRAIGRGISPGQHVSRHKSRGMEFAEARPYQSGDDARMLDWRQTARRGRPFTKLFQEEHERPVQLLIDMGPSMRFGTRVAFKSVQAARAAALLAWRSAEAGDRVGGLVCNGTSISAIRPQGHQHGVLALLAGLALASKSPPAQAMDWVAPLRALTHSLRPGSLAVIISDFATLDAKAARQLLILGTSTELMLVHVYDNFEAEVPPPARYPLTDGQQRLNLDLRGPEARGAYSAIFDERRRMLTHLARQSGADLLPLGTHQSPKDVLAANLVRGLGWRVHRTRFSA